MTDLSQLISPTEARWDLLDCNAVTESDMEVSALLILNLLQNISLDKLIILWKDLINFFR